MKLVFAKHSGFCFGVRSAVEAAEKNAGPHTYTFGEIIHSERVLDALKQKGVKRKSSSNKSQVLLLFLKQRP